MSDCRAQLEVSLLTFRKDRTGGLRWYGVVSRLGVSGRMAGVVCNTMAADEEKKGEERMKSTTSAGIGGM